MSLRYPPAIKAVNRTKETYFILSKKGRPMKRVKFTCESCGAKDLKRTQVELDHKVPVTGKEGFTTWDSFINGLFCEEDNLWLICIECHRAKTELENKERDGYSKHNNVIEVPKTNFKKKSKK